MTSMKECEAETIKDKGNEKFKERDYQGAIDLYTQALDMHFGLTILLNRAQAYIELKDYLSAYVDASEALRMDPKSEKGLVRRAICRLELGFETGAVKDLEAALKENPKSEQTKRYLDEAKMRVAAAEVKRKQFSPTATTAEDAGKKMRAEDVDALE